jgi:hypothetical protein
VIRTAPDGATVTAAIGPTDRGTLWRATKHYEHDRIVRLVDARFCDERFREALRHLRERHYPQALEIVAEGWSGADYALEYAVHRPLWTLGELLRRCPHWTGRLYLLWRLCDSFGQWQRDPLLSVGMGLHNIVVTDDTDEPQPWLLPCPAVRLSAPNDLFGTDPTVLSAIAPETVRGVPLNQRAQDRYALGTLAALALGCWPSRLVHDDGERVEAQARGALLLPTESRSEVEPFLRGTPQVAQLFSTIKHYRHTLPEARPAGVGQLRSALAAVTELRDLAESLERDDPDGAVEVLCWAGDRDEGYLVDCLGRAAKICVRHGRVAAAMDHLDRAVALAPDHFDLRRLRAEARWALLTATPDGVTDAGLYDLVADLVFVDRRAPEPDPVHLQRAAEAYRRLGDPYAEVEALYTALEIDGGNVDVLFRYGECLKELRRCPEAAAVAGVAKARLDTLTEIGRYTKEERNRWHAKFDTLLDC